MLARDADKNMDYGGLDPVQKVSGFTLPSLCRQAVDYGFPTSDNPIKVAICHLSLCDFCWIFLILKTARSSSEGNPGRAPGLWRSPAIVLFFRPWFNSF